MNQCTAADDRTPDAALDNERLPKVHSWRLGPLALSWAWSPRGLWGSAAEGGQSRIYLQVSSVTRETASGEVAAIRVIIGRLGVWIA